MQNAPQDDIWRVLDTLKTPILTTLDAIFNRSLSIFSEIFPVFGSADNAPPKTGTKSWGALK